MDIQVLINIAVVTGIGLIAWLGRELWNAVKELRKDITAIEVALPTHYVRRDEFRSGVQELKEMLVKISDKLDAKVDKQ